MKQKDWLKVRKKFLEGKVNHQGFYEADCGHWTKYPHVHHLSKRSTNPELADDFKNLSIQCAACHLKIHS